MQTLGDTILKPFHAFTKTLQFSACYQQVFCNFSQWSSVPLVFFLGYDITWFLDNFFYALKLGSSYDEFVVFAYVSFNTSTGGC